MYDDWIEANAAAYPIRRDCAGATLRMCRAFPALRRVKGYVLLSSGEEATHWWCEDPSGAVVDPTEAQWAPAYPVEYTEEVEELGKCMNCGDVFVVSGMCSTFCGAECRDETAAYLNSRWR